MKNLVLNLRNAKAQAGCATSGNRSHSSLPFREGVGLGFFMRVFLLTLLLTLAVGQMWAWNFTGDNFIYFHNKGSWNDSGKMLFIGKNDYTTVYTMSAVTGNSSLWVVKITNAGWSDATYMAVAGGGSVWGSGSWGPGNRTNATHYTNTYTSGLDASNNQRYILIPASSSNNANLSLDYLGTDEPNYTITVKAKVSIDGGSNYSEATSPGTLSASSKKFTAYNSCNSSTSLSSGTITCGYLYSTTLTAPSTDPTGYTFVGWYNSSGTQQTTSKTLTIKPTANATYYAYYKANQYNGTIDKNGGAADQSYTATYKTTSLTIATAPSRTGYTLSGYYKEAACTTLVANTSKALQASTTYTNSSKQWTYTSAPTLYAGWTANQYTITFDKQSGTGGTASAKVHYDNNDFTVSPVEMPTRTGYTLGGYYTSTGGAGVQIVNASGVWQSNKASYLDASGNWIYANNKTVYAKWTAKTYTITFNPQTSAPGYSTSGSISCGSATYDATAPSISGTNPTAANGYCFMGFYTEPLGEGVKLVNTDKSWVASVAGYTDASSHWIHDGDVTLYAFYKKAEITVAIDQSVFEPVAAGGSSWVQATPTVEPEPVGPVKICWALLYDDENPVPAGHDPVTVSGNVVKFNLAGLAAGSYRIRATLRTGSSCDEGTLLSTFDKSVTIANEFTVTVKYMCGTEEIKASTTTPGKATEWTSIDAPDIFGYTFSTWDLGDGGITKHESDALTKKTGFRFKASYNGTLTAKYNKKNIVYFKNTLNWSNVYVYFYGSDGYWNATNGAGSKGVTTNTMTNISGTDIWYFEYTGDKQKHIAFTKDKQDNYENFYNTKAAYPSRGGTEADGYFNNQGFNAATPMFVPNTTKKETKNGTDYFSNGYWTTYLGGSGYTLKIYNQVGSGRTEVKTITFTRGDDKTMPYYAEVDLEAGKTYGFKFERSDGIYYYYNGTLTVSNSGTAKVFPFDGTDHNAAGLQTNAAGIYRFTLGCNSDGNLNVSVTYPVKTGDFRIVYTDNATWSLGSAHTINTWKHPSRIISSRANGVDTVSFFISKGASITSKIRWEKSTAVAAGSVTWGATGSWTTQSVDSAAVYNFRIVQNADGSSISSITNIGAYTGEYYIRCDAMNSKWDNYTSDNDHRMTYSSFSESDANAFGEKFSHYKAKWCKYGKNVKFVIANDYSPCISDTLTQDVPNTYDNIDDYGFLRDDGTVEETQNIYSANIRFMWNRKTNKISRAYVASSTNPERLFLVLRGNYAIHGQDGSDIEDEGTGIPSVILQDDQNWMYEEILYIKPGTRFKLYACYAQVSANPDGAQYFRGAYDSNQFTTDANSVILIDGDGDYQKARVLYDFKTNRLICAWLPSNADVSGTNNINADVMIIREHQEAAQYITFADADSKLTGVKTVYGVMKFNRWVLNNRKSTGTHQPLDVGDQKSEFERSLYFISFPFDVRVSDIFGFGHYWDEWYLEYYDGLTRAKNGFWIDSPPNWKYVTPEMATNYVLKANEGYILGLDLEYMPYNNEEFWAHDIETIELFFPSTAELATLKQTTCTIPALSSDYKCTINRTGEDGDRRVKDSYWRCIGTPSLNLYNTAVTDGSGNAISWKTDYTWHADEREFPFIYMWNKTDNTLTPQSTSTFNFLPMHSYLVQNGGQIVWTNVSAKPSSIVARNADDTPAMSYNWRLALISDTTLIDQTYVRMNNLEQVTDTFDFGQDLSKEFNAKRSDIYTKIGYERVAANSMPLNTKTTTIVPVGIKVYKAGEFKLAMPDGTDGIGVTLIDNETGIHTQLGALDYTVTLDKGTYDERFYLEISPIHNTPTDLGGVNSNQPSAVRKVIIDQNMYIIRDGKMYNVQGARCN